MPKRERDGQRERVYKKARRVRKRLSSSVEVPVSASRKQREELAESFHSSKASAAAPTTITTTNSVQYVPRKLINIVKNERRNTIYIFVSDLSNCARVCVCECV